MVDYRPDKIQRVLLKISGEFLAGKKGFGFCHETIQSLVDDIIELKRIGISIGIVLGGGNLFRGSIGESEGIDRVVGDNVGMLATVQNALVVSDFLSKRNVRAEILSAIKIDKVSKFYTPERAKTSLQEGKICFLCGGTGNPYFTTDTAAVLRGIELQANLVLKGTKVDGVFSSDPVKDKNAVFYQDLTFSEALKKNLHVMDMTAFSLAKDNDMRIKVFNILQSGNLKKAVLDKNFGTLVHS